MSKLLFGKKIIWKNPDDLGHFGIKLRKQVAEQRLVEQISNRACQKEVNSMFFVARVSSKGHFVSACNLTKIYPFFMVVSQGVEQAPRKYDGCTKIIFWASEEEGEQLAEQQGKEEIIRFEVRPLIEEDDPTTFIRLQFFIRVKGMHV